MKDSAQKSVRDYGKKAEKNKNDRRKNHIQDIRRIRGKTQNHRHNTTRKRWKHQKNNNRRRGW